MYRWGAKGTGPSAFRIDRGNGLRLILRQTKKNGEVESGGPRYGSRSMMAMHWNYVFFFLKKEMSCMVSSDVQALACQCCHACHVWQGIIVHFRPNFQWVDIWVTSFRLSVVYSVVMWMNFFVKRWTTDAGFPRAHPPSALVQEYWCRQWCYSLARFSAQDAHIIYFLIVAISGPLSVLQSSTYINLKKQCITPVRRTSKSAKAQPSSESKAYKACGVCPLSLQI